MLALSYIDNFDVESEEITVCGYDFYHGLAMIATYNSHGTPILHLVSFDPDRAEDIQFSDCEDDRLTFPMEDVPCPLVRTYDNVVKLFLLSSGDYLHSVTLLGWDDLGFNRFNVDKLHDLLH